MPARRYAARVRFSPVVLTALSLLVLPAAGLAEPAPAPNAAPTADRPAPPRAGWSGTVKSDLGRLWSTRSVTILAVGAAASIASVGSENPERTVTLLDRVPFEGPADFGNEYGAGTTLAALSGLMLGIGHFAHDAGLKQAGSELARSLIYTGIGVTALKVAIGRTRPNGGAYSFPSGHTAAAFAAAPVLARHFGYRAGVPAYLLASATAMGRMEDRKHYLSDVLFGASVGLAVGLAVSDDDATSKRFSLEPAGAGAAIRYRF
jgi:membrane-associated phospholipid phosphatase